MDTTVHTLAILLNLVLLYLVLAHSRFKIKDYQKFFLMPCLGDLALATIVLIGEPIVLYEEGYFILVANGFFHGRSAIFDYVCVSVYCGMLHANVVIVVVQFIWRYQLVCKTTGTTPFVKTWKALIPLFYSAPQAANTFYMFALSTDPLTSKTTGRRILERLCWHPGTTAYPGMGYVSTVHAAFHHTFYTLTLCGGFLIVVWCQYKVMKHLRRHGKALRESTRQMQVEVDRALVALAAAPLITSIGPTLILLNCVFFSFSAGPVMVYLSVGMSLITVTNPLTTIYFVRPYRKAIVGVVRKATKVGSSISNRIHPQTAHAVTDPSSTNESYEARSDDVH